MILWKRRVKRAGLRLNIEKPKIMASSPIAAWQIEGEKVEVVTDFLFLCSKITVDGESSHEIRRWLLLDIKVMTNLENVLKSRDITLPINSISSKLWSSQWSHMVVRLDRKEGRTPKNWCLQTLVLEKTPESLLDSKEIKPVNLKGNHPWIFTGRTDAEAEAPVFWSSDMNIQLIGKVPDAGKDRGQKEKRASEDEMAGQHHWYNEHELGQTPGDGEGQGGLVYYSPWGRKELDTAGWLNKRTLVFVFLFLTYFTLSDSF